MAILMGKKIPIPAAPPTTAQRDNLPNRIMRIREGEAFGMTCTPSAARSTIKRLLASDKVKGFWAVWDGPRENGISTANVACLTSAQAKSWEDAQPGSVMSAAAATGEAHRAA
jgi:hypothetical protein